MLSGSPVAYQAFIESARYAAEQRNYYWQYERETVDDKTIRVATGVGPYPKKGDKITDQPAHDGGKNFGRLARYGIMGTYVAEMKNTPLRGIPVNAWLGFFHRFAKEAPARQD